MTGPRVIILGATSAVAEAAARRWAARGAALLLVGRRTGELERIAADLAVRGAATVDVASADLAQTPGGALLGDFAARLGGVDVILLAYGVLTDQARAEADLGYAAAQLQVNFTSAALWSLAAADLLERQGRGSLVVIGSVAGDRGRRSNYVYGAAKAGLAALVQGLAHRLAASGARAVVIKPGFIDSPMTAHLPKGGPLWAKPDAIARIVLAASDGKAPVVYAPGFWRLILLIIRLVPASVFHRTRL